MIDSWPEKKQRLDTENTLHVQKYQEIFHHRWTSFVGGNGTSSSSKGSILNPGNYEWPFEIIIPGSIAESVEGLRETYIVYKLKARVSRGKLAHDLLALKPVRIIRTLESDNPDLTQPMSVENVWPNKIEYSVSIPEKAAIFGTAVDVDMRFTLLLKGLRVGDIKCQIMEIVELTVESNVKPEIEKNYKHERQIGISIFQMTEENYQEVISDNGQDGYVLSEKLPLPKKLSECLQDCDIHGIKVRHRVKFTISLHNPDGHVSEVFDVYVFLLCISKNKTKHPPKFNFSRLTIISKLRATIPITIYFSPTQPITAEGELVDQGINGRNSVDVSHHAPPLYGDHILDQPFAGIYQSGLRSPAVESGMNTPLFAHSRSGSSENLAFFDGAISPYTMRESTITPAALSSRLQNLSFSSRNSSFRRLTGLGNSGSSTPHLYPNAESEQSNGFDSYHRSDYFRYSTYSSNPISRRGSGDEYFSALASGQHTPNYADISEMVELSKVPSYRTAAKTPIRNMNNDYLPNYQTALSSPPSPTRTQVNLVLSPVNLVNDNNSNPNNSGSGSTQSAEMSSTGNPTGNSAQQTPQFDTQNRRRIPLQLNRRRGLS